MASLPFTYLFLLGTTPKLSLRELKAVSKRHVFSIESINQSFAGTTSNIDPARIMAELGGTVKILQLIKKTSKETLQADLTDFLNQNDISRYAISGPGSINPQALAKDIKPTLNKTSRSVRYKLIPNQYYSALDGTYTECLVVNLDNSLHLTQTAAVQDIDHWSKKDYGRPQVDPKSGMLPPKVARMMVNISLPSKITLKTTLYDPFCGSGTVLMEAMELGCRVIGSDIDQSSVKDTRSNLAWFNAEINSTSSYSLFEKDATQLKLSDLENPVDAIVFEGYLGPPNIKERQFDQYIKGLNNLYLGVLKKLHPLLKPGAKLVAALPEYHANGRVKKLDRLVDSCEKLGYTRSGSLVVYGKDAATIKRTILTLTKK